MEKGELIPVMYKQVSIKGVSGGIQHITTVEYSDVSGDLLLLERGTWIIGYDVTVVQENCSCGIALANEKGVISNTVSYCGLNNDVKIIFPVSRQTIIKVPTPAPMNIKLVMRRIGDAGYCAILGNWGTSNPNYPMPHNNSTLWALAI